MEAYVGEYASGKSENAVNRAIELAKQNRKVTLVDLDIVEPVYTLRPIKKELHALGIDVVAWDTKETVGLGEAGTIIKPEMRWVLARTGDIIIDIGYGAEGAKTLNLVEGALNNPELKIYLVINIARPMTMTEEDIYQYALELKPVHGLINNSHLGDETDLEIIQEGAKMVSVVASRLNLPVIGTAVEESFGAQIGNQDCMGNPIRLLKRLMPKAFW
jgi:hypothetical protein